ncbi:hypothetical protein [Flavobacterium sp.]|uniref:hypothetical protein n=1 Tax=Flavobacterium sp. TaxID=239 RepID=UPI003D09D752
MKMIVLAPIEVEILLCNEMEQKITSLNFYFISEFSELRLKRIAGLAPEKFKNQAQKNSFQINETSFFITKR